MSEQPKGDTFDNFFPWGLTEADRPRVDELMTRGLWHGGYGIFVLATSRPATRELAAAHYNALHPGADIDPSWFGEPFLRRNCAACAAEALAAA